MDEHHEEQEHLPQRLREATEHVEALRREAADITADLRNQLHVLTLEREALQRLDSHRQERIEHLSRP